MHAIPSSAKAGDSALEALVDAAAGILSADSLPGTLGRIAHHLATLVPFDDLSLHEVEEGRQAFSRGEVNRARLVALQLQAVLDRLVRR